MAIDILLNLMLVSLGFSAVLGPFLLSFGTVFLGDFTAPVRKLAARVFGVKDSSPKSKKVMPHARMSLMHGLFDDHSDETIMDISI